MKRNFLKFRRKVRRVRILGALAAGASLGAAVSGVLHALSRLAILDFAPMLSVPIGAGCGLAAMLVAYLLLGISDKKLARMLDARFALSERVQTSVAFEGETGGMVELQREDTERTLEAIPVRAFKTKGAWLFLLALLIGGGILTASFFAPNRRDEVPPEIIVPYEITEVQIAGIEELIRYVDASEMQEPYRKNISDSLARLLAELRAATTEPKMQASLASALTAIAEETYASSSSAEILNALWSTKDASVRLLAQALNTGDWTAPDWGDFAEKYSAWRSFFTESDMDVTDEEARKAVLKGTLDAFSRKTEGALISSEIASEDALCAVLNRLLDGDGGAASGISQLSTRAEGMRYEEMTAGLQTVLDAMAEPIYDVISMQKINTNVGEYVLKKLSSLFGVPIPPAERPSLQKDAESGVDDDSDRDDEDGPSGGGVGEGAVFGSNDLVLDPLTGEYVEYGILYATYNARMLEKLGDDKYGYTEEQKTAIEKYFALLYGGFKEEEGN